MDICEKIDNAYHLWQEYDNSIRQIKKLLSEEGFLSDESVCTLIDLLGRARAGRERYYKRLVTLLSIATDGEGDEDEAE